ncbi:hypothetical protein JW905_02755 [bacterium]|nr:hypothetical protein [candidate division CSSED10-310 bacterium]
MHGVSGVKKYFRISMALLFGTIVAVVLVELAGRLYFLVSVGTCARDRLLLAERGNTYIVQRLAQAKSIIDCDCPHPYLISTERRNDARSGSNNVGMFGPDFPLSKDDKTFTILVSGGSVATQFAQERPAGIRYFQDILNERYDFQGRPAVVLNGARGGWKHPQQFIMLLLFGDVIDGFITIEGFNELVCACGEGFNKDLTYPAEDFAFLHADAGYGYEHILAAYMVERSYLLALHHPVFKHSAFIYLVSKAFRTRLSNWDQKHREGIPKPCYDDFFRLPADWSKARKKAHFLSRYKHFMRAMHASAESMGVRSVSFLQPVPPIQKNLTRMERAVMGDDGYRDDYQLMVDELLKLRQEGVPVVSMLDLFKDCREQVYADYVHCLEAEPDGRSLGYSLMAEHIADVLELEWNLQRK